MWGDLCSDIHGYVMLLKEYGNCWTWIPSHLNTPFASPRCWMPSKTETNLWGASLIFSDLKQLWMIPFVKKFSRKQKFMFFFCVICWLWKGAHTIFHISKDVYHINTVHIYYSISNLHPSPIIPSSPIQNMLSKRFSTKGPTNSQ